jgi:hypothetical protein
MSIAQIQTKAYIFPKTQVYTKMQKYMSLFLTYDKTGATTLLYLK